MGNEKRPGAIPALFLCLPVISARLADTHGNMLLNKFLTLRNENLHD